MTPTGSLATGIENLKIEGGRESGPLVLNLLPSHLPRPPLSHLLIFSFPVGTLTRKVPGRLIQAIRSFNKQLYRWEVAEFQSSSDGSGEVK